MGKLSMNNFSHWWRTSTSCWDQYKCIRNINM